MVKKIILLSGMPAVGKDTVTDYLTSNFDTYTNFKKHKSSSNPSDIKSSYINISHDEFELKKAQGDFVQHHSRYNNQYGIDRKSLYNILESNKIPIIHVGRIENFITIKDNLSNIKIIHILLWETYEVLKERITEREKTDIDIEKRIFALKQELSDIKSLKDSNNFYDFIIQNSNLQDTCNYINTIANLSQELKFNQYIESYNDSIFKFNDHDKE